MSRTGSAQALESLAWHFNFFPGQSLSINEVAQSTGLAWATARKFAATLEMIKQIAPETILDVDGIRILRQPDQVAQALVQPMASAALYIFVHGRLAESPKGPIDLELHRLYAEVYSEAIKDLLGLGLAKQNGAYLELTPAGLALASDIYGDLVSRTQSLLGAQGPSQDFAEVPQRLAVPSSTGMLVYDARQGVLVALE